MPVLFLLEDSLPLANMVCRIANRLGWTVVCARSLEEATEKCSDGGLRVDAALIDLMIPETKIDLRKVDDLLAQRNEQSMIVSRSTKKSDLSPDKQNAIARLDILDKEIAKFIAVEGGVKFLHSDEAKSVLPKDKTTVAFFSARRQSTKTATEREQLIETVKDALGRDPAMWFDKPICSLDLEDWLAKCLAESINPIR